MFSSIPAILCSRSVILEELPGSFHVFTNRKGSSFSLALGHVLRQAVFLSMGGPEET